MPDTSAPTTQQIPVDKIVPSPFQARKNFDEEKLKDLAQTMKDRGLKNAINVRQVGDHYELVAGERRWRAAKLLGWTTIKAEIETASDQESTLDGLLENLQREDLNAIERAQGYKRLVDMGLTQSEIAGRAGKKQWDISESLSLLGLTDEVKEIMERSIISSGHGDALLRLTNPDQQKEMAQKVVQGGWSVKQTEEEVNKLLGGSSKESKNHKTKGKAAHNGDVQPSVPDPLADLWAPVQMRAANSGVAWGVTYGPHQITNQKGINLPSWQFWVANNSISPKVHLKRWLAMLSDAIGDTSQDEAAMKAAGISYVSQEVPPAPQALTPVPAPIPAAPVEKPINPRTAAMIANLKAKGGLR